MLKPTKKEIPAFLPFTDDFIFNLVMRDKEICAGFLKMILPDEEFTEIRLLPKNHSLFSDEPLDMEDFDPAKMAVEIQKSLKFEKGKHGVRFDALVKGPEQWAEIEMQTYVRTFDEKLALPLDDDAYKIILNTACPAENVPDHLKAFYAYINNPERNQGSDFIKALDSRVRKFNTPEWRHRAMTLEELMARREKQGYETGVAEGIERLNKLGQLLAENNRVDDLLRSLKDTEYQQQLMEEFGL